MYIIRKPKFLISTIGAALLLLTTACGSNDVKETNYESKPWEIDTFQYCPDFSSPYNNDTSTNPVFRVHFMFDDSSIFLQTQKKLDEVADCLSDLLIYRYENEEPINDIKFLIEGHADIRGDADYNFALGGRRSASTIGYLAVATESVLKNKISDIEAIKGTDYEKLLDSSFINSLFCPLSKGSSELLETGSDINSHATNRRTELYVVKSCQSSKSTNVLETKSSSDSTKNSIDDSNDDLYFSMSDDDEKDIVID